MPKRAPAQKLTKSFIEKLPFPSKGQKFYWDTEIMGFGIRVTPTVKSFILDRKLHGCTSIRSTIGRFPTWSVEQARLEAKDLSIQIDKGIDPREGRKKHKTEGVTLQAAFDRFLLERPLKPRTVYDYKRYFNASASNGKTKFYDDWATLPIVSITPDMVARRYAKLKASSCGVSQASSAMRALRSVLNFAIETYELGIPNPVAALSQRRIWIKDTKRQTHLHANEIQPFIRAVRSQPNRVIATYLEFILFTGCRRSEAAKLKWSDINQKARTLTFTNTKNGEDRTIPITNRVKELLDAMENLKMGEYVFASLNKQGKPTHISEPRKVLARANSSAGTAVTVHDLRRTYATIMESIDCPMVPLKDLLGHSRKHDVTTGHYIVPNVERLRPWVEKYDAHLQSLIGQGSESSPLTPEAATT